jgi:hypothetical protein
MIDAGLVLDLFTSFDMVFHSSRLLNRTHDFDADDDFDQDETASSTVDHLMFYNPTSTGNKGPSTVGSRRRPDLIGAFAAIEPSFGIYRHL